MNRPLQSIHITLQYYTLRLATVPSGVSVLQITISLSGLQLEALLTKALPHFCCLPSWRNGVVSRKKRTQC